MRVKDRQKRANEAFTKPLTTHLTRAKGDFSCRDNAVMLRKVLNVTVLKAKTFHCCRRIFSKIVASSAKVHVVAL